MYSLIILCNIRLIKYILSHGWSIKLVLDGAFPLHTESPGGNDLVESLIVKLLIEQDEDDNPSM